MNEYIVILMVAGLILIISIGLSILKRNVYRNLYLSLNNENYGYFFEKIDSHIVRALLTIYTREIMKFSIYIKLNQTQNVTEQMNRMMKMHLNQYQLNDILAKGFHYYSLNKDKNKCKKILKKMNETMEITQIEKYQRHYNIVLDNSINYREEIEKSFPLHRGKMRGYLEYLLALSYQSNCNLEKYEEYIHLAAEDYKTNVRELERKIQIM